MLQHGLFPGFVAPVAKECAKQLCKLGVDVIVVTVGQRSSESAAEPFEFSVHCVEDHHVFDKYRQLKRFLDDCSPNLVHYFPGKGLELLPLLNGRVRYIFNYISVSVSGNSVLDRMVDFGKRLQPAFADHVIFTDEALMRSLRPIFRKPMSLMPVGYPDDLFYPCGPNVEHKERLLVYHGAVRAQRKLDRLIEVLSRLSEEYRLIIIGGGASADEQYRLYLASLAKSLNCSSRLILDNMPQAEIRAVIGRAYLCLSYVPMLECYQDQFVLKTVEYLACQRPVLSTATRYTMQFRHTIGHDSILLTDGSVDDMVSKIMNAGQFIEAFYSESNLTALSVALAAHSSRHIVQTKLLPIYESVLN